MAPKNSSCFNPQSKLSGTSYTGAQNNFKYFASVNFTFGGK